MENKCIGNISVKIHSKSSEMIKSDPSIMNMKNTQYISGIKKKILNLVTFILIVEGIPCCKPIPIAHNHPKKTPVENNINIGNILKSILKSASKGAP